MTGMDLAAFLTARLDEDEQVARAAFCSLAGTDRWVAGRANTDGVGTEAGTPVTLHLWPAEMDHIARHDPARVLADVDAKRQIIYFLGQPDMPDGEGKFVAEWALDQGATIEQAASSSGCAAVLVGRYAKRRMR